MPDNQIQRPEITNVNLFYVENKQINFYAILQRKRIKLYVTQQQSTTPE